MLYRAWLFIGYVINQSPRYDFSFIAVLFYIATREVARGIIMKMKRDLKGLKNVVFSFMGLESIQVLPPVKSIADVESGLTEKNAFINQWAVGIGKGEALNLACFLKYCKSQSCTFAIKDVITSNEFKNWIIYTKLDGNYRTRLKKRERKQLEALLAKYGK